MRLAHGNRIEAPLLLGVDLGTQGLKVIIVDAETRAIMATAGALVANFAPALQAQYERLYAVFKRWADRVAAGVGLEDLSPRSPRTREGTE